MIVLLLYTALLLDVSTNFSKFLWHTSGPVVRPKSPSPLHRSGNVSVKLGICQFYSDFGDMSYCLLPLPSFFIAESHESEFLYKLLSVSKCRVCSISLEPPHFVTSTQGCRICH